jgi:hypothetical protein
LGLAALLEIPMRFTPIFCLSVILLACGCGSSQPEHEVKPLTARPVDKNAPTQFSTPEEKIRYIENSKAPESVKQQAIAKIKAGG